MDRMQSREGRAAIEQEIDTLDSITLGKRIKELAEEGSLIAKKLQADNLTEVERDQLGMKLQAIVELGTKLATRKKMLEESLTANS